MLLVVQHTRKTIKTTNWQHYEILSIVKKFNSFHSTPMRHLFGLSYIKQNIALNKQNLSLHLLISSTAFLFTPSFLRKSVISELFFLLCNIGVLLFYSPSSRAC